MYLIGNPKTLLKIGWMSLIRPTSEIASKLTFGKAFGWANPEISLAAKRGGESNSMGTIKKMAQAYFLQKGEKGLEKLYNDGEQRYQDAVKKYEDYKGTDNLSKDKLDNLKQNMNNEMANTIGNFMYKFIGGSSIKDASQALFNRSNQIERMFGDLGVEHFDFSKKITQENLNYLMGFIGRSHSALKTFSGRTNFAAGFMARVEAAIDAKENINGTRLLEMGHESYLDWQRGKYQQSNWV